MADPVGTVGGARQAETDFGLVLKGGPDLGARLQQLADARTAHDAAFERLSLGKSAQAALDAANHKLSDAEQLNRLARATVEEARSTAKDIVEKASKQASEVSKASLAAKVKAEADANVLLKDAEGYAKRVRDEADAGKAEMDKRMADVTAAEERAKAAEAAARTAANKSSKATAAANALSKDLQAKIDQLLAAIKAVS